MHAIEIKGAQKSFPGFTLGPLDLAVRRGEVFGIFGPPSAGKTSVLRLILGLLPQDKGAVLVGGADAASMEASERDMSMVFQNLALFPHMSGRENIVFPLVERNVPEDEIAVRLDAVSEVLHVSHILHKKPAQMSGGERQRIALGRALVVDSRAILLDEPISALDARLREEMRVELKRLQRTKNQTFVYVSHDEEEVMAISDRVAVMIDGQIAQIGEPDEIYNRPGTLGVAKVVGSPPMNLFEGRFSSDGRYFECEDFAVPYPLVREALKGKVATVGIRPEDIREDDAAASHEIALRSIEPLGGYTIVNAVLGHRLVKIRASGRVTSVDRYGRRVTFDPRHLHVFDGEGSRCDG